MVSYPDAMIVTPPSDLILDGGLCWIVHTGTSRFAIHHKAQDRGHRCYVGRGSYWEFCGWTEARREEVGKPLPQGLTRHGKYAGYVSGCRCPPCKEAAVAYRQAKDQRR